MMKVFEYQCHLGGLGYYTLTRADGTLAIDGIPGPRTEAAIRTFQEEHRQRPDGSVLVPDGYWGPKTEAALRQVIGNNEPPQVTAEPGHGNRQWITRDDFRCKCGGKYCNGFPAEPHAKTLDLLNAFGNHFGKKPVVHSGLRCEQHNANTPGASPNSKHKLGMAVDFHIDGVSPEALRDYGETLMPDWGGIGIYSWGIHIDDRPVKGRWDCR